MLYNPPTGSIDSNAPYLGKNLTTSQQGSRVPPMAIEAVQREIVAAIVAAGLNPTNTDLTQLLKAIHILGAGVPSRIMPFLGAGTYSYVVPAGVYKLDVSAWGAGGGGGGTSVGNNAAGGGGGGGFSRKIIRVSPGDSFTILNGAAGVGGPGSGPNNGTAGGATSFGSILSATGGGPGLGANPNAISAGGTGGTGSGGDIGAGGGGGAGGTQGTFASGVIVYMGGPGGYSPFGGSLSAGSIAQGAVGPGPGAGGSGGSNGGGGAAGAAGGTLVLEG